MTSEVEQIKNRREKKEDKRTRFTFTCTVRTSTVSIVQDYLILSSFIHAKTMMNEAPTTLAEAKRRSDLQADHERLENLASIRADLQKAYKEVTTKRNGSTTDSNIGNSSFYITPSTTSTSTFLRLNAIQSESLLKSKLDDSENQIREICDSVQGRISVNP